MLFCCSEEPDTLHSTNKVLPKLLAGEDKNKLEDLGLVWKG